MTAVGFAYGARAALAGAGATEIHVIDEVTEGGDFLVGVDCERDGTKYEMSMVAGSEAFRERARDMVMDAVRRFTREHGG